MHIKRCTGIIITLFYFTNCEIELLDTNELSVYNFSNVITNIFNTEKTDRISGLQKKIDSINQYVIDNDRFSELLRNLTREYDKQYNETTFFEALNNEDNFTKWLSLKEVELKSVYLQMKEKMTRDDIVAIMNKTDDAQMRRSARRMLDNNHASGDTKRMHEVIDKYIAEVPSDKHQFSDLDNRTIYWDPQSELQDLQEHHQHNGRRLFRGERTTVRIYPFMVSVHVMGRFWCGGAIYWNDIVITSAACLQLMHNNRFFRENPRVLSVRIGSNHSRIGGEIVDALEVYFHPGYDPRSLRNNIAVIRLQRHLRFSYHRVPKAIELSHEAQGLPSTAEVLLLGWGVSRTSQTMNYQPIFLQKKVLPIYPSLFCKEVYGEKFVAETMFCAGTLTTGEGACDHDAGGPAVYAGRLVGVISFGPAVCGFPDAPTVFTLVGAFSDWIETINETMPNYYRSKKRTTISTRSPVLKYFDQYIERRKTTPSSTTGIQPIAETTHFRMEDMVEGTETEPEKNTLSSTDNTVTTLNPVFLKFGNEKRKNKKQKKSKRSKRKWQLEAEQESAEPRFRGKVGKKSHKKVHRVESFDSKE